MKARLGSSGARGALSVAALLCASGCSSRAYEGESMTVVGPSKEGFGKVVETLDYSCGNLACHGSPVRNLRLYGDQGRRLDDGGVPCGKPTTPAEIETDYLSLITLEPEVMAQVVADHGAHPERLTLVRKARGTEKHKGGTVLRASTDMPACLAACGDDRGCTRSCYGDACLVSWIAGAVDVAACSNSLPETRCNPQ